MIYIEDTGVRLVYEKTTELAEDINNGSTLSEVRAWIEGLIREHGEDATLDLDIIEEAPYRYHIESAVRRTATESEYQQYLRDQAAKIEQRKREIEQHEREQLARLKAKFEGANNADT